MRIHFDEAHRLFHLSGLLKCPTPSVLLPMDGCATCTGGRH